MRHAHAALGALVLFSCGGPGALSVTITMPAGSIYANGKVMVTVVPNGVKSGTAVVLKSDGKELAQLMPPYTYEWDTTQVSEGAHMLTAHVSAGAATADSQPVTVTVDRTAPQVLT